MYPSPAPENLHFLNTSDFMRRWVEVHPDLNRTRLLRWMGEQVWALIYGDGARIQVEAVARFACMFALDDERRGYLRPPALRYNAHRRSPMSLMDRTLNR